MLLRRFVLFVMSLGAVSAQVDTGAISGLVRDPSGAGIPGVQVKLRNEATGLTTEAATNPTGLYVSPPLRAGTYVVEARAEGFEAAAKRVQLDLSQRFEVDFDLVVGAVSSTVAVKDVAGTLQTESATLSNLRSEQAVKDLPLNSRNFAQLITLSAGAMPAQSQTTGSPITMKRGAVGASINGTRLEENNFLVDGILNNENHNGLGILIFPIVDAIEEFRVEASVANAQFGRGGGGTINLTGTSVRSVSVPCATLKVRMKSLAAPASTSATLIPGIGRSVSSLTVWAPGTVTTGASLTALMSLNSFIGSNCLKSPATHNSGCRWPSQTHFSALKSRPSQRPHHGANWMSASTGTKFFS